MLMAYPNIGTVAVNISQVKASELNDTTNCAQFLLISTQLIAKGFSVVF